MKKTLGMIVAILVASLLSGCIVLREQGAYTEGNFSYTPKYVPPPVQIPMVQYCAPVSRIYGGRIFWREECEWRQAPAYNPAYGYNYDYGFNVFVGSGSKKHGGHHEKNRHHNKRERGRQR